MAHLPPAVATGPLRIRFTPLDAWSGDFDPASLGTTPLKLQMDDDETYIVQARIVEMASGANLRTLTGHSRSVNALAALDGGRLEELAAVGRLRGHDPGSPHDGGGALQWAY